MPFAVLCQASAPDNSVSHEHGQTLFTTITTELLLPQKIRFDKGLGYKNHPKPILNKGF